MSTRTIALLLVVPAVAMAARSRARRQMWAATEHRGPAGIEFRGHGPRWAGGPRPFGRRVPPMLKAMFDEWHQAAHAEAADVTV